jgi:hypothetical protein
MSNVSEKEGKETSSKIALGILQKRKESIPTEIDNEYFFLNTRKTS